MTAALDHLGVVFTPYAWLGHVLLGLCIQLVVAAPLRLAKVRAAWWFGAAVSAGFWWGREKVEYEFALKGLAGLRTVGPFWWRGWLPFEWGARSAWEFLAPALACLLAAAAIERRRGSPLGTAATAPHVAWSTGQVAARQGGTQPEASLAEPDEPGRRLDP